MTVTSEHVPDLLGPIALDRARTLSWVMFVATLAWVLVIIITGRMSATLAVTYSVLLIVVLSVALVARRTSRASLGHALCAAIWLAPVLGTIMAEYLAPAPLHEILLPLELIATIILLDTRWVIGGLGVVLLVWTALSVHTNIDPMMHIMTAATAAVFAIVMQILMRRATLTQAVTATELTVQLAERKRLEQQVLHTQRLEAVGTLAAGLAHDMNNVLAAITSFASVLEDEVRSERGRADLAQIVEQSARGAALTRGLLAFSRKGQYRKETIRIDDVVLEVMPMLTRTLPRSIVIRDELNGDKLCVDGDPIQLGQALINLGLNAADAMDGKGTVVLRTEVIDVDTKTAIELSLKPGRYARMRVSDTGTGMTEETRRRAFEPFFTTKPAGKGTGLGLSAVWGIVHSHDGTVTVESVEGKGSTFSLYLPVVDATVPSRPLPVLMRTEQVQRIGTVLIVDDEPAVRSGTARILERMGLSTIQAENGAEGLAQVREHGATIDLVILDMGMPVMGGAECFRKIRELSTTPVLIATGYALDEDVQGMVAAGAALIEKPYPSNDLQVVVKRLLETAKPAPLSR